LQFGGEFFDLDLVGVPVEGGFFDFVESEWNRAYLTLYYSRLMASLSISAA
jgi:hypothetical protein